MKRGHYRNHNRLITKLFCSHTFHEWRNWKHSLNGSCFVVYEGEPHRKLCHMLSAKHSTSVTLSSLQSTDLYVEVVTGRISVALKINLWTTHILCLKSSNPASPTLPQTSYRVVSPSDSLHPRLQVEHGETRTKNNVLRSTCIASLTCILKYKI